MSESASSYVFRCTECGEVWVDPPAPVTGHHCDHHGHGMPTGEAAEVECIRECVNCGGDLDGRVCTACGHAQYTGAD